MRKDGNRLRFKEPLTSWRQPAAYKEDGEEKERIMGTDYKVLGETPPQIPLTPAIGDYVTETAADVGFPGDFKFQRNLARSYLRF